MKITIYDGGDTIGGNKIHLEDSRTGLFLDFGMNFRKYGEYFQEYLRERSSRGIHDLLSLDLIPKLRIYRPDLIPSDVNPMEFPEVRVDAVLLSHAHLDHCGNVGLLNGEIPLVASPFTLAILKAIKDTSRSALGSEIVYFSPREAKEGEGRLLLSSKRYLGRKLVFTDEISEELRFFLLDTPRREIEGLSLESLEETGLEIEAFEVDHSIYGATGYLVRGETSLAYTGDLRMHGKNRKKTKEFIKGARESEVLIIEGTRASREDYNESEETVFMNCLEEVENSRDLVIADFSPRNFERLETFLEIARRTGRELVVTTKEAYLLQALELVDGKERIIKDLRIYHRLKSRRDAWEKLVLETWADLLVDPIEISKNEENYILCFSFYDLINLLDLKPSGGLYIYSSSEAFSEEQEFDFLRLHNWIEKFGMKLKGFELEFHSGKIRPRFVRGYHASGHASKEDLRRIIEGIDPDVIIPVHTERPEWFEENFEGVLVLRNGESQELG